MKKISVILFFLISSIFAFGQTQPIQNLGAPNNIVVVRGELGIDTGFVLRTNYADTATLNLSNYLRGKAGTIARVENGLWMRSQDTTTWLGIGGQSLSTENSNTVLFSGDGSPPNPLVANVNVSGQPGNILQSFADGVFAQSPIQNGLQSGGIITWVSGYTYDITTATYVIGGVTYLAPEDQITLANSDPTDDRIDLVVANSSSAFEVIEGTPAADPQNPSYDATTQIPLSFILVTAASVQPSPVPDQDYIYLNDAEWTTSSSTARINPASTTNPFSPTKDIEFTLARNADFITFTDPTQPTDLTDFSVLTMKIRSKATWNAAARLVFRFYNDGIAVGNEVYIANNAFGFNSAVTATYQTVSMPLQLFGGLTDVDQLYVTVTTINNNTIGLYLDDIQLQSGIVPIAGSFWAQGGNSWGQVGIFGTLDNNYISFISNATERMRLLTNGKLVIGAGADNGVGGVLQVSGTVSGTADNAVPLGTSTRRFLELWSDIHQGTSYMRFNIGGVTAGQIQPTTRNLVYGTDPTVDIASSLASFNSTTKGILVPRMTTVQKDAIGTPATGLLVFDTDLNSFYVYYSAAWHPIGGGGFVTADNGLTASSATNVQLFGPVGTPSTLLNSRSLDASTFQLAITGSVGTEVLNIANTGNGTAIYGTVSGNGTGVSGNASVSGIGVSGISSSGVGVYAQSTSNTALEAFSTSSIAASFFILPATTSTVAEVLIVSRSSSGTAANGIGGSIGFYNKTSGAGGQPISNQLISKWTTSDNATRTSQFIITGVNSAVTGDILTLDGDGTMTLGAAYQGLGAGYLAVSDAGEVTWSAGGGGGGGDALTANPLSQFAATTSAQLAGVISDETGSGVLVFGTSPTITSATLVTPVLGTPSSGTLTNATGLPISTGVSGLGTGVATALAINTGSAGAIVLFDGALGTPTSGTATNLTGLPLTTGVTGILPITNGGTGLSVLGTAGQFLMVNAGATGLEYATVSGSGTVTGITLTQPAAGITITNSGVAITTTGTRTFSLADDLAAVEGLATTGIVRRTGTSTWTAGTAVSLTTEVSGTLPVANGGTGQTTYTNGQLLIGNSSGNTLTKATLTAGTGISITNGTGSISIALAYNPSEQTLSDGATINWDAANGATATVTLNGTGRTLALPTNLIAGYTYTLYVIQGAGGSKTITTWTNVEWPDGTPVTLSTAAGAIDIVQFIYKGSNGLLYATYGNNFQ